MDNLLAYEALGIVQQPEVPGREIARLIHDGIPESLHGQIISWDTLYKDDNK